MPGHDAGCPWCGRRTASPQVTRAGLVCGFIGGIGFAAASMLKLVEVTSGYEMNWHSILEQTTGLFNGARPGRRDVAAVAVRPGRRTTTPARLHPDGLRPVRLAFVVLGITYLNLRKNAGEWVRVGAMPKEMVGLSTGAWFDLAYLLIAPDLPDPPDPALAGAPGDPAGEPDGSGAAPVCPAALVAGRRQLRASPGLVRAPTPGERRGSSGRSGWPVPCSSWLAAQTRKAPRPSARGRRKSVAGPDPAGGPAGRGRFHPHRLGRRSRHLRRQVRWPRQSPHPLRPEGHDTHQAEKR